MKSLNKLLAVSVAVVGLGLATMPLQSQARTVVHHYYSNGQYCGSCSTCHSCCNTCGYYHNRSVFWPLLPF